MTCGRTRKEASISDSLQNQGDQADRANAATLGITIIADNVAVTPDGENATGHFNVNGYTQMANQIEAGFVALLA